jgi:hypothetical protein
MIIKPFASVGDLKLGITREEAEKILGKLKRQRKENYGCEEYYCLVGEYEYYCLSFDENGLCRILYQLERKNKEKIELYGIDLAHTPAEEIIPALEKYAACEWDQSDKDLSYFYTFPSIGVMLFRSSAFHPKLLETDYFADWDPEAAEDEKKYQYFEAVILASEEKYF